MFFKYRHEGYLEKNLTSYSCIFLITSKYTNLF